MIEKLDKKQRLNYLLFRPRLAHDELQRLRKIVKMKGLNVTETELRNAVFSGCPLFFVEDTQEQDWK